MIVLFYFVISAITFVFSGVELIPERLQTAVGVLCLAVLFIVDLLVDMFVLFCISTRRKK